jgi:hypothetical protein
MYYRNNVITHVTVLYFECHLHLLQQQAVNGVLPAGPQVHLKLGAVHHGASSSRGAAGGGAAAAAAAAAAVAGHNARAYGLERPGKKRRSLYGQLPTKRGFDGFACCK